MSYWLQRKDYAVDKYREAWERIGSGLSAGEAPPTQDAADIIRS